MRYDATHDVHMQVLLHKIRSLSGYITYPGAREKCCPG
jgi:hypothetical protein